MSEREKLANRSLNKMKSRTTHTHSHIEMLFGYFPVFLLFFGRFPLFWRLQRIPFCIWISHHKLHTMCEHGTMCKNGMKIKCSFRYRLAFDCFRPLKLTAYTVVDLYWRWIKPVEYSKSRTKRVLVKINDIEKRNETERQPRRKKPGERQQQNIYTN